MFVTKKHLPRRQLLRGLAGSLALPLLDAMIPARTLLAQTAAAPKPRLACIEMVHGAAGSTLDGSNKHYWSPQKEGPDFEFTQTLSPLEAYREHLTIISHTDLNPAGADTAVWLAADDGRPIQSTGGFWLDRRPRAIHRLPSTRRSDSPERRRQLWAWASEQAARS